MSNDNTPPKPPGLSPILMPGRNGAGRRRAFIPSDPTTDMLKKTEHAKWLEEFSVILSLDTGVEMTPFRQGQITRLHWASLYIQYLEKKNKQLKEAMDALKKTRANVRPVKS